MLRRSISAAVAACVVGIGISAVLMPNAAMAATYPDVAGQPVPFGDAAGYGAPTGALSAPVVSMASTSDSKGYWLVASDGGIFNYGDAGFYGSAGGAHLAQPIVGMAATPDGKGYWLVASDGGIFNYGDAGFYGSTGNVHLAKPIVGMAATPDGKGYWLVASDGGIFAFGDAGFHGSTGNIQLAQPVVGMAATNDGKGYWLVASDGGIFAFGDAGFHGSTGNIHLTQPVVGMAATNDGKGYWLVASDGGIFSFGDAVFYGSMGGAALPNPVTGIAATRDDRGYWLLPTKPAAVPAPVVVPTVTLQEGATGPQVLTLQQRLTALGYWNATPDGTFGDATLQAVYAFQKAAGITPDGVAGSQTDAALAAGVVPHPQSTSGYVIEINLQDDLLMFVNNGKAEYTLNTSTGGGYTYTEDGVTSVADTPTGHFDTFRVVDGTVTDSLGTLYRPRFFYEGFAIHGDSSVPPYPVSHGCARVSNEAIDWIWANNLDPIGTAVWVY